MHLEAFFAPYLMAMETGRITTPTLGASLQCISAQPDFEVHLRNLPRKTRCVLQGYSTPDNAEVLGAFLGRFGIDGEELHAVDLYNLEVVYKELNLPLPRLKYHLADATALPKTFEAAFDLVIQDFLLNCVPHADQPRLLSETARVLSKAGLALIHFTDASGLARLPRKTEQVLEKEHGFHWESSTYQISDMGRAKGEEAALIAQLGGRVVVDEQLDQFTYVTATDGHFEFFTDASRIYAMFRKAGLTLISQTIREGIDFHGLLCRRHYCLLRKEKP
jgi:ubiquinone/menaquinone biosynthesis C-methylase UbiE